MVPMVVVWGQPLLGCAGVRGAREAWACLRAAFLAPGQASRRWRCDNTARWPSFDILGLEAFFFCMKALPNVVVT